MPTPRRSLISGCALLTTSCLVGCCTPAVLEPQPPWDDPVAQQAQWSHTLDWLLGIAAGLLLGAYLLLAHAWTRWRIEQRTGGTGTDDQS